MKILGKCWFTEMGGNIIGIVLVELTPAEKQCFGTNSSKAAFIGTASSWDTEDKDATLIIERGARFPVKAAEVLMGISTTPD